MLEKLCVVLYQNHVIQLNSCGLIISASWVLAFNLFLARLFSFIIVVINSFMHACVFATKQAPGYFDPCCSRVVFNPSKRV